MLGWLLDTNDVKMAMEGSIITEDKISVRPEDICPSIVDSSVNVTSLRKYFDEDAWKLIENVLSVVRSNIVYMCNTCNLKIDDATEDSVRCDSCLQWTHFMCVGLKSSPQKSSWFCPPCLDGHCWPADYFLFHICMAMRLNSTPEKGVSITFSPWHIRF